MTSYEWSSIQCHCSPNDKRLGQRHILQRKDAVSQDAVDQEVVHQDVVDQDAVDQDADSEKPALLALSSQLWLPGRDTTCFLPATHSGVPFREALTR